MYALTALVKCHLVYIIGLHAGCSRQTIKILGHYISSSEVSAVMGTTLSMLIRIELAQPGAQILMGKQPTL